MTALKPVLLCLAAVAAFAVGNLAMMVTAPAAHSVEVVAGE